jgi:hypothetical protein
VSENVGRANPDLTAARRPSPTFSRMSCALSGLVSPLIPVTTDPCQSRLFHNPYPRCHGGIGRFVFCTEYVYKYPEFRQQNSSTMHTVLLGLLHLKQSICKHKRAHVSQNRTDSAKLVLRPGPDPRERTWQILNIPPAYAAWPRIGYLRGGTYWRYQPY